MAKIPKFDEDTARRLFEVTPGTKKEKAAALAQFYGIESISSDFEKGTYRSWVSRWVAVGRKNFP